MARRNGVTTAFDTVAELGPGDSLGVGLAALISGARTYYGLDVYKYADPGRNLEMFDGLVELFRRREPIPQEDASMAPRLDSYGFPYFAFEEKALEAALEDARIDRLRDNLRDFEGPDCPVRYIVPWEDPSVIAAGSIDMLLSQAVLELVPSLQSAYRAMYAWLKPGGHMSHQIDFSDPRTSAKWNGNWTHSDFVWSCLRGKRAHWGNREAHSAHIRFLQEAGFQVVCDLTTRNYTGAPKRRIARRFHHLSDDDLTTSEAFILAKRPVCRVS
jgi:hypothetical protein